MTDREWALIEPFMPPPKPVGRPRTADLRDVVNAILYIATTGCQWAMLPNDLPSVLDRPALLPRLARQPVAAVGPLHPRPADPRPGGAGGAADGGRHRQASRWRHWFEPTGERVKTTESGGLRGHDAGKKINGRKRHAVVDTIGLPFGVVVHAADVRDRDGAPAVLASIRRSCPWLRHVFADGGHAGPKLGGALDRSASGRSRS